MDTLSFRKLEPRDASLLKDLLALYVAVSGDQTLPTDTSYLDRLIRHPATQFFVGLQHDRVVAGATAYTLPSIYGDFDELYIYDMAVNADLQQQGIGSGLLEYKKQYAKQHRVKTVFVQADTEDNHARNFYKKNGGVEEDVRHYDFEI